MSSSSNFVASREKVWTAADHREDGESVRLAPPIADLVIDLQDGVASDQTVTLVPTSAMLTTQQAADILDVSRPYLSKLLTTGKIPFVSVGSHRCVLHADLMAYIDRLGQEFDARLDAARGPSCRPARCQRPVSVPQERHSLALRPCRIVQGAMDRPDSSR